MDRSDGSVRELARLDPPGATPVLGCVETGRWATVKYVPANLSPAAASRWIAACSPGTIWLIGRTRQNTEAPLL